MSLPSPETFLDNRARIEREVRDALADPKPVESLVEVVVSECIELRERISQRIIGKLIERGDGLTSEQLERLAWIVEQHYETPDGYIDVVEPPAIKGLKAL